MNYLPRWATERLGKVGNKIVLELMGLDRGESKEPECHLLFVIIAAWRGADDPQGGGLGPGRDSLRGLSKLSVTEVGLAQVSYPSGPHSRRSPKRGGETGGGWEGL